MQKKDGAGQWTWSGYFVERGNPVGTRAVLGPTIELVDGSPIRGD